MQEPVPGHSQPHRSSRVGWLRAAVLGANDGIISIAGLVGGMAAAGADKATLLVTAAAGTVAAAMSMAAGEYVSVRSQADTERADLDIERRALREAPAIELEELTRIYQKRGLQRALAEQVARQLTAHDALGAHARDELGLSQTLRARPLQAALASSCAFLAGAALPVAAAVVSPHAHVEATIWASTIVGLAVSGGLAARIGGAPVARGALRVAFWGMLAMLAASLIGRLFDVPA